MSIKELEECLTAAPISDDAPDESIILEGTENTGTLYLSNMDFLSNTEAIQKAQISAILSVGFFPFLNIDKVPLYKPTNCQIKNFKSKQPIEEEREEDKYEEMPTHMKILVNDIVEENLKKYFDKTYEFINFYLNKNKNVLVHCLVGGSRSASIVIAYLMRKKKWKLQEALFYVKSRREQTCPNKGFLKQLKKFEDEIMPLEKDTLFAAQSFSQINFNLPQGNEMNSINNNFLCNINSAIPPNNQLSNTQIEAENSINNKLLALSTNNFNAAPEKQLTLRRQESLKQALKECQQEEQYETEIQQDTQQQIEMEPEVQIVLEGELHNYQQQQQNTPEQSQPDYKNQVQNGEVQSLELQLSQSQL